MSSGDLLRDVVNKIAGIHFASSDELHTPGALCTCPPLVVIELKKPGVPARAAFDENPTNHVGAGSHYFFSEITA